MNMFIAAFLGSLFAIVVVLNAMPLISRIMNRIRYGGQLPIGIMPSEAQRDRMLEVLDADEDLRVAILDVSIDDDRPEAYERVIDMARKWRALIDDDQAKRIRSVSRLSARARTRRDGANT